MTGTAIEKKNIAIILDHDESRFQVMVNEFNKLSLLKEEVFCEYLVLSNHFRNWSAVNKYYDCLIMVTEIKSDCRFIGYAGKELANNKTLSSSILCVVTPKHIKLNVSDEVCRLRPLLHDRIQIVISESTPGYSCIESAMEQFEITRSANGPKINRAECPVGIIHISDLHAPAWDPVARTALIKDIRQLDMPSKRLLFVSGDVSNNGWKRNVHAASDYIFDLANNMDILKEDVFVCPGNHDCATRIFGVALALLPKLKRFRKFFPPPSFADVLGASWFSQINVPEQLSLGVFVLDSTKSRFLAQGSIRSDTRDWIKQKGMDFCAANPRGILLAILHHHIMNDPSLNNQGAHILVDDGPFKATACQAGVDIVLHGHQHLGWQTDIPGHEFINRKFYVVAAGSAVKTIDLANNQHNPKIRANQYNFILLGPQGFVVFSRRLNNNDFETADFTEKYYLRPRK